MPCYKIAIRGLPMRCYLSRIIFLSSSSLKGGFTKDLFNSIKDPNLDHISAASDL